MRVAPWRVVHEGGSLEGSTGLHPVDHVYCTQHERHTQHACAAYFIIASEVQSACRVWRYAVLQPCFACRVWRYAVLQPPCATALALAFRV